MLYVFDSAQCVHVFLNKLNKGCCEIGEAFSVMPAQQQLAIQRHPGYALTLKAPVLQLPDDGIPGND